MIPSAAIFNENQWAAQGGLIGLIIFAGVCILVMVLRANSKQQADSQKRAQEFAADLLDKHSEERQEDRKERILATSKTADSMTGVANALTDLTIYLKSNNHPKKGN